MIERIATIALLTSGFFMVGTAATAHGCASSTLAEIEAEANRAYAQQSAAHPVDDRATLRLIAQQARSARQACGA